MQKANQISTIKTKSYIQPWIHKHMYIADIDQEISLSTSVMMRIVFASLAYANSVVCITKTSKKEPETFLVHFTADPVQKWEHRLTHSP
jgi:hypothetical protein